jgi:hypothetical protein
MQGTICKFLGTKTEFQKSLGHFCKITSTDEFLELINYFLLKIGGIGPRSHGPGLSRGSTGLRIH